MKYHVGVRPLRQMAMLMVTASSCPPDGASNPESTASSGVSTTQTTPRTTRLSK